MRIKGKLVDISGEPLVGANIYPVDQNGKSFGQGTITDIDGNFDAELEDVTGASDVIISYIGYRTLNKKLSELDGKTLIMLEGAEQLDEVVINYKKPQQIIKKSHFETFGLYYAGLGVLGLILLFVKIKK